MELVKLGRAVAALLGSAALFGCGQPQTSALKIRGGDSVAANDVGPEHLSTVGLQGVTQAGVYTCSAALLTPRLLVTAGHCVEAGAKLYAFFGTDMRPATTAADYTAVVGSRVHPDYQGDGHGDSSGLVPHDVAVLQLAAPAPAPWAPTPRLAADDGLVAGAQVRLAGFGITEAGDGLNVLRAVDTTFVGIDDQARLEIDDPARRGACSGDSGGPLFVPDAGGVWHLGGVLSGGPIPCRGVNRYTSVAANRVFLDQAVHELGD